MFQRNLVNQEEKNRGKYGKMKKNARLDLHGDWTVADFVVSSVSQNIFQGTLHELPKRQCRHVSCAQATYPKNGNSSQTS
jgi:hypothetical protein